MKLVLEWVKDQGGLEAMEQVNRQKKDLVYGMIDAHPDFFRGTVETLCGCSAKAALFATEAPYLAQLGLETLVLGAGDIRVAHQPDEYVTIAGIEGATDLYVSLIRRYCTEAP